MKTFKEFLAEAYWPPRNAKEALEVLRDDAEELEAGGRDWVRALRLTPDWEEKLPAFKGKWIRTLKTMFEGYREKHEMIKMELKEKEKEPENLTIETRSV